jgi:hypothetical protein
MPNLFAYIALWTWPVVAFVLFRRLPIPQAMIWTLIGGYLLLPTGVLINFPGVPALDKTSIPALCAAILCFMSSRKFNTLRFPRTAQPAALVGLRLIDQRRNIGNGSIPPIFKVLLALLIVLPVFTALNNPEALAFGPTILPGLSAYDAASMAIHMFLMIIPFGLAVKYLGGSGSQYLLLKILTVSAVLYSIPALFEVRMSPQLHNWIYGFFPHVFAQHMRLGGFRPVVFLEHGLWLGMFFLIAFIAAVTLWKNAQSRSTDKRKWLFAACWIFLTLVLSKNFGALILAMCALVILIGFQRRMQLLIMLVVALFVLSYPALRGGDIVPTVTLVELAETVDADRAASLNFRFFHEDRLLERANQKPWSGWGSWGRNRVFDPVTGHDISVTDGRWLQVLGRYGWSGYVLQFGVLSLPLILLWSICRKNWDSVDFLTVGIAMMLVVSLIDLIPNNTISPVTWLIAGALVARLGALRQDLTSVDRQRVTTARGRRTKRALSMDVT